MCSTLTPLASLQHGAAVPRTQTSPLTALPVHVYAVVVVDVVGCPLHLDLKAVWFAKHAVWSGYATGMAGETSPHDAVADDIRFRHSMEDLISSFYYLLYFWFSCTFFHDHHHFFHDHDEWPSLVNGCVNDWKGS